MKAPKARKLPSGSWFVRVMVDGKSINITRDTEKEAVAEAMTVKAGLKYENKPENITLTKAIDRYIEDRSEILSPATIRGYRTLQNNRFQSLMGCKVAKIDTQAVQKAVNQDAKTVGAKTIKNALGLISGVLGYYGIQIGKLTLPEQQKQEKHIYNRDELCRLLDASRETNAELPVLLAAWLGLRRSEILGLKWDAIDFENAVLHVREAIVPGEDHKMVSKGTKTAASNRSLNCPRYILDVLQRVERKSEYVVPLHTAVIYKSLEKACEKAQIQNIGLHGLRHQMASTLLLLNVPDKQVMELGGWSNIQTPKKIYQHTTQEGRDAAVDALDQYFYSLVRTQKDRYKLAPGGIPRRKPPKKFKIVSRSKRA